LPGRSETGSPLPLKRVEGRHQSNHFA